MARTERCRAFWKWPASDVYKRQIYNAMPLDGVQALVSFMKEFEARNG